MKRSGYFIGYLIFGVFVLFFLLASHTNADNLDTSFTIGETIRYSINTLGIKIGTQTIKIVSQEYFNGIPVYRIYGITKTTGLSMLFHQYSEHQTVLIDSSTLYPVWIERNVEDRGIPSSYAYFIDQAQQKVVIFDRMSGDKKIIHTNNVVFDRFSLCYFYRKNPLVFKGNFSFDFLKKDSVNTVFMREEGLAQINIPKLSFNNTTTTKKFIEKGGDGIEIYTGTDGFSIPLKIVFRTPNQNKKKSTVIELYIMDYKVNTDNTNIPEQYRILLKRDLIVMNSLPSSPNP